jgi:hypothetical protein
MSVQSMCTGEPALVPGELRGYRMWRVRSGQLVANNSFNGEWMRGRLDAICRRSDMTKPSHDAPAEGCGCGIYGWYRPDEARLHRGDVFGVVAVSGRVLLGDFGFRAQRGRVLAVVVEPPVRLSGTEISATGSLTLPGSAMWSQGIQWEERQPFIAWCERNSIAVFESREQLLEEFPPEDVRELLGRDIPDEPPAALWHVTTIPAAAYGKTFAAAQARLAAAFDDMRKALSKMLGIQVSGGAGYARQAVSWSSASSGTPVVDVMQRALEARKRGTRGPEKRRRGRARLSL